MNIPEWTLSTYDESVTIPPLLQSDGARNDITIEIESDGNVCIEMYSDDNRTRVPLDKLRELIAAWDIWKARQP